MDAADGKGGNSAGASEEDHHLLQPDQPPEQEKLIALTPAFVIDRPGVIQIKRTLAPGGRARLRPGKGILGKGQPLREKPDSLRRRLLPDEPSRELTGLTLKARRIGEDRLKILRRPEDGHAGIGKGRMLRAPKQGERQAHAKQTRRQPADSQHTEPIDRHNPHEDPTGIATSTRPQNRPS